MAKFTISLDKIIDEFKLETIYTPKNASEIEIDEADVTRPGLQLMGFYEYFNPERIQIIGKMEYAYLSTIDEETRVQRLDMLFSQRIPALVISRELPYFEEMLDLAKKYSVPLLRSKESTSNFIAGLIAFLNLNLAPRITRHGVLIEIYGEGVFITGESGVGKSETAIELVKRGFRERFSRLLRCFFKKSMWNLRHNANAIAGGAVSVLAGAVLKLFNDLQRVVYCPMRFLPADIDNGADAAGVMLRLLRQRSIRM